MKKIFYFIPFILGACSFIAFAIIGSSVAPDGTLVEPFYLIPIGYALFLFGIILLTIKLIFSQYKKYKIH